MPQITPRGKYIFGWALINSQHEIIIPPETLKEYHLSIGGIAILISGSKTSGGFCLANQLFIQHPQFKGLFNRYPFLLTHKQSEGDCSHTRAVFTDGYG